MHKSKMFKKARAKYMADISLKPAKDLIRISLSLLTAAVVLIYL